MHAGAGVARGRRRQGRGARVRRSRPGRGTHREPGLLRLLLCLEREQAQHRAEPAFRRGARTPPAARAEVRRVRRELRTRRRGETRRRLRRPAGGPSRHHLRAHQGVRDRRSVRRLSLHGHDRASRRRRLFDHRRGGRTADDAGSHHGRRGHGRADGDGDPGRLRPEAAHRGRPADRGVDAGGHDVLRAHPCLHRVSMGHPRGRPQRQFGRTATGRPLPLQALRAERLRLPHARHRRPLGRSLHRHGPPRPPDRSPLRGHGGPRAERAGPPRGDREVVQHTHQVRGHGDDRRGRGAVLGHPRHARPVRG